MDPNACYKRWWRALLEEDRDEAIDAWHDLKEWLDRGGFAPNWGEHGKKQFYQFDTLTGSGAGY